MSDMIEVKQVESKGLYDITQFLRDVAPYVVVCGSFARREERIDSDIDCYLRNRPPEEVDPEIGNDTYMPEIADLIARHGLVSDSVIVGHIDVERQLGFPRMIEISSLYKLPSTEPLFYLEIEGVPMLCCRDDKEISSSETYDDLDWDDSISDMVIRNPLPAYEPKGI